MILIEVRNRIKTKDYDYDYDYDHDSRFKECHYNFSQLIFAQALSWQMLCHYCRFWLSLSLRHSEFCLAF